MRQDKEKTESLERQREAGVQNYSLLFDNNSINGNYYLLWLTFQEIYIEILCHR